MAANLGPVVRVVLAAACIAAATIFVPGLNDIRHIGLVFLVSAFVLGLWQVIDPRATGGSFADANLDRQSAKRRTMIVSISAGVGALAGAALANVFWSDYGWAGAGLGALIGCSLGYRIADIRGR